MSQSTPIAAATDPRLLLAVEQLGKRFCLHMLGAMALPVLHGFSFQVREGDFAVLSGPSGSGKSTVLKCIYRSYLATEGSIYFRCADDTWLDIVQCDEQQILSLRQHEIGYVSQFLRCAPRVAAEEVVASPRIAFPEASNSVSTWPAPSSRNRDCCCWMNRRQALIIVPSKRSGRRSRKSVKMVRRVWPSFMIGCLSIGSQPGWLL
jgi:energy-coupling factor transporter ATP-binding protein EcfA2